MTNHIHDDWGDDGGLGPTLDAFAEARLRADVERTVVVRAQVVAAARARAWSVAGASTPSGGAPRRGWLGLPRLARAPLLAGAGLLLVAAIAGGALAATAPGGPLYGARLWVEELTLPAAPEARTEAQIDRLDERLDEAVRAAESGDVGATVAALDEYWVTAGAALAAAGDDAARREHVTAEIGRHVVILTALTERVPDRAAEAIQAAVDRAEERIQELLDRIPGKPATPGGPDGATPRPAKTPPGKPEATPAPAKSPPGKPEATTRPERTPPGKPAETPARDKPATPAP